MELSLCTVDLLQVTGNKRMPGTESSLHTEVTQSVNKDEPVHLEGILCAHGAYLRIRECHADDIACMSVIPDSIVSF